MEYNVSLSPMPVRCQTSVTMQIHSENSSVSRSPYLCRFIAQFYIIQIYFYENSIFPHCAYGKEKNTKNLFHTFII